VANVAPLAFQFSRFPADNSLRRFLEQLFHSAQIFSESRKRFRERIIRSAPYALLLQRQRSIEQRSAPAILLIASLVCSMCGPTKAAEPAHRSCAPPPGSLHRTSGECARANHRKDVRFAGAIHCDAGQHIIELRLNASSASCCVVPSRDEN